MVFFNVFAKKLRSHSGQNTSRYKIGKRVSDVIYIQQIRTIPINGQKGCQDSSKGSQSTEFSQFFSPVNAAGPAANNERRLYSLATVFLAVKVFNDVF